MDHARCELNPHSANSSYRCHPTFWLSIYVILCPFTLLSVMFFNLTVTVDIGTIMVIDDSQHARYPGRFLKVCVNKDINAIYMK